MTTSNSYIKNLKPQTTIIGSGKPTIVLLGSIHGNEPVGTRIFESIKKNVTLDRGSIVCIICNPPALAKKVRYIDADLNRVFPGNLSGNTEEKLAYKITNLIKNCDMLIDIHSCSTPSKSFCILREGNKTAMQMAINSGLGNIVIYPQSTQGGASSIDMIASGIGVELGLHNRKETFINGYNAVLNILKFAGMTQCKNTPTFHSENPKIIRVIRHLRKTSSMKLNDKIKNLTLVKKGRILARDGKHTLYAEEDFYPILYGERAYQDVLCWVGKDVS